MTYSVIDQETIFVTRGTDSFLIHSLSVPTATLIKDSTLIDKGLKYNCEFISLFARVFEENTGLNFNNMILTPDAHENLLRIMFFNREDS